MSCKINYKNKTKTTNCKANKPFIASSMPIQTKLNIGASNDSYELEADSIADQVVNMSNVQVQKQTGALVQRKCSACEQEDKIRKKPISYQITSNIQRSAMSDSKGGPATNALISRINAKRGRGVTMDSSTKQFMESRFGSDFSDVRIHTGSEAIQMSKDIGAQAFTVGNDIFFNEGKYNTNSTSGKHLLAHELTHTIQQRGVQRKMIQRDWVLEPSRPNAIPKTLNPREITAAITYNQYFLNNIPNSKATIRLIRDVLGVSPDPAIIDTDFVAGVLEWQAVNRHTQDGKLGPNSSRTLFREIGAENQGKCELASGPQYNPSGIVAVNAVGNKSTFFRFSADFKSDPSNKLLPSCREVRQYIRWNTAALGTFAPGIVPHTGFPAAHPANRWIEDRDQNNKRYGRRS
ncbi:MAG: DUF4157 domain-containing protein, partial [Saprospiraceae bacterium]|nr:DUF4157 domain-containing protein [Saprospiraceae bacterium]